jgi:hypothetical protein
MAKTDSAPIYTNRPFVTISIMFENNKVATRGNVRSGLGKCRAHTSSPSSSEPGLTVTTQVTDKPG